MERFLKPTPQRQFDRGTDDWVEILDYVIETRNKEIKRKCSHPFVPATYLFYGGIAAESAEFVEHLFK